METAGCYAPGGRVSVNLRIQILQQLINVLPQYPLPSSVIMTAVTARVAGVEKVGRRSHSSPVKPTSTDPLPPFCPSDRFIFPPFPLCSQVWVASPRPAAVTLAAAYVSGADALLAVGGAQAIAAMAYGVGGVPACDVIVGPGNRYAAPPAATAQITRQHSTQSAQRQYHTYPHHVTSRACLHPLLPSPPLYTPCLPQLGDCR